MEPSTTRLYRAVSIAELTDIRRVGGLGLPSGEAAFRASEAKLFAMNREDALAWGRQLYVDAARFAVIEAEVPAGLVARLHAGTADRRPYVAVDRDDLAELNRVALIRVIS